MMPVIRLSDATFRNLQAIAEPFVDTPSSVIDKLVSAELGRRGRSVNDEVWRQDETDHSSDFSGEQAPPLTHTTVDEASVAGKSLEKPNWGRILLSAIKTVKDKGFTGRELANQLEINASASRLSENGYRYYPDLGISVQGQSAADAWRESRRLAKRHKFDVFVAFSWPNKQGAAFPGTSAFMKLEG